MPRVMTDPGRVRAHLAGQAETCRKLGSDFTGRVLDLLAVRLDESTAIGRKTPPAKRPGQIFGGSDTRKMGNPNTILCFRMS